MTIEVRHIEVVRTARYALLRPEGPVRRIWVLLHGHAMLAERFLGYLEPMAGPGTLLVAPEALNRFYLGTRLDGGHDQQVGATWMTREARDSEIADMLEYLDRLMQQVTPPEYPQVPVAVLGFSQGVATAARWLTKGRIRPAMLALWGAPIPADCPLEVIAVLMRYKELRLIAGEEDPIVPSGLIERLVEEWGAVGLKAEAERFPGGHVLHAATARRLAEQFAAQTP
jgi:predicted esterase